MAIAFGVAAEEMMVHHQHVVMDVGLDVALLTTLSRMIQHHDAASFYLWEYPSARTIQLFQKILSFYSIMWPVQTKIYLSNKGSIILVIDARPISRNV